MIMTLSQVLTFNLLLGLVHDILPPLESLLHPLSGPWLLHISYIGLWFSRLLQDKIQNYYFPEFSRYFLEH